MKNYSCRHQWLHQNEFMWLAILEINGNLGMETYRITIHTIEIDDLKYSIYKFQKFDFNKREWTMEIVTSNYPISVFISIKDLCTEHMNYYNVQNVVFSTKDLKRRKLFDYYKRYFEKHSFIVYEKEILNHYTYVCFRGKELIQKKASGELEDYLDRTCKMDKFY